MKTKILLLLATIFFIGCQKDELPTQTATIDKACECRKQIFTKFNVLNVPEFFYVRTEDWQKVNCDVKKGSLQSNGYTLSPLIISGANYYKWECK